MLPKAKVEVLRAVPPRRDPAEFDAFHEDRVREDLAEFSEAPGLLEQYVQRARVRFRKSGERAILGQWEAFYQAGERLLAAKVAMERQKSEYLQLAHEHEVNETEKKTALARLRADGEEHDLRRDRAANQRQTATSDAGATIQGALTEDEHNLRQACERRQLDARWELNESLRPLQSLIELQRWRRQQREQILKDRSLSPEEQSEDLQFVDDLYQQKHAEIRADTRVFEEQ